MRTATGQDNSTWQQDHCTGPQMSWPHTEGGGRLPASEHMAASSCQL